MHEKERLVSFILQVYPMPEEQARTISDHFDKRVFSRNEYLLKEGKQCNDYYFLEEGYARAFTFDLEGIEVTTGFYSPNSIVCELFSFFKRIPSEENIVTLTDCTAWHLSFDGLQKVFHEMLLFREFGRTILVTAYSNLKQNMLSSLHKTAEERYAELLEKNAGIFQHAPLKQIASYLGITDTSLSRIRKEFLKHQASE